MSRPAMCRLTLLGLVLSAIPLPALAQPCLPDCLAAQKSEWHRVRTESIGVNGFDPQNHDLTDGAATLLSFSPPKATDGVHEWPPIDGLKHTVCGRLHRRLHYRAPVVSDERDADHYVVPTHPYCESISDVEFAFPASRKYVLCCPWAPQSRGRCSPRCLEAEITPAEAMNVELFAEFFPATRLQIGDDPLAICTYGPWVGDSGHGWRPEIHPAQMLWSRPQPTGPLMLALFQDASRRYGRPSQFIQKRRPRRWRPWSEGPVAGEFSVAFKTPLATPAELHVKAIQHSGAAAPAPPQAPGDGCTRASEDKLEYLDRGRVVASVSGLKTSPFAARFEGICLDQDAQEIIGYLGLSGAVGGPDCVEEGFALVAVSGDGLARPKTIGEELWCPGDQALVAATAPALGSTPPVHLSALITKDVPKGGKRWASHSIRDSEGIVQQAGGLWRVGSLDLRKATPPLPVLRADGWEVEVMPYYENAEPEDDVAGAVEHRDRRALERLLGAQAPLRLDAAWTVSATDLTADQDVPVYDETSPSRPRRRPRPDELVVSPLDRGGRGGRLSKLPYPAIKVRFPQTPRDHLYQVWLEVRLSDGLGHGGGGLAHLIWSHGVDGRNRRQLLESALALAGDGSTSIDDLIAVASPRPGSDQRSASHARILLASTARLAEKGFVTIDEFGSLLLAASKLRRPEP